MEKIIPVNTPIIRKQDIVNVAKTLKKGWVSSNGPEVLKFEDAFAKFLNKKYCISVSSGTAALEIAVKALNIKKNDEIIIPNFTIISNALAVIKQDAKPVLVDSDLNTWNIKIDEIEKKITKRTKAIIATHIYNFPIDMDRILKICKKYKLYLIEDAAEVIGQKYKKKRCGSFGDISTFSFYANKQITTGEGGMLATNNLKLYKKCCSLRNLCFGKKNRFNHDDIGWNYRMSNIQAALGLSQLKNIKSIVKKKFFTGNEYYQRLKNNKNLLILKPKCDFAKNIYWVIGIIILNKSLNMDAKNLAKKLKSFGIITRPFFWPMHKQKIFLKMKLFNKEKFPNSEYMSKFGLYLPSGLALKKKDIHYICKKLNNIL